MGVRAGSFDALNLELRGHAYVLVARERAPALADAGHHARVELPPVGLRALLSAAVGEPGAGLAAARIFAQTSPRSPAERELLARRLVALVDSGRALLYRDTRPRALTLDDAPEQLDEPARDEIAERSDWIEVLIEDRAGEPVANVRYILTLADGSTREGRTNRQGLLRYDRIASGSCTISLPDHDAELWELG